MERDDPVENKMKSLAAPAAPPARASAQRPSLRMVHGPKPVIELPISRSSIFAVLYNAACPISSRGCRDLHPLWADEARHRVLNLFSLTLMLERQVSSEAEPVDHRQELAVATRLAALYRSLEEAREEENVACSETLHDLVAGLIGLFGPAVGKVSLRTRLIPLAMTAYRRRALILTASALVIQALVQPSIVAAWREVEITLVLEGSRNMRFSIEIEGTGIDPQRSGSGHEVVICLAGLLEAEIVYRRSMRGGISAELNFPSA
jgi:hypothetical protein